MLRKWGALVLLLLAMPALAFAQNTGKLAGRILDGSNGEGLPGATVILEGTTFGTATDLDGNYFIIGVPVGSYDIKASFVGYQSKRVEGVQISTGYTREIHFTIDPGVELDEIVVTYEKPLIQKDAIGVPKIVSAEEIIRLPVRGVANVAKIQAGVVAKEGSGTLNIRGGRGSEVTYYIDGIKVFGTTALPQSAIEEQEMIIGSINARYGDAMSGIINITTKSGSSKFFGSIEGISSESLDDYGYNLASATLGGPIIPGKLSFFMAGEFTDLADSNPRAVGQIYVGDSVLDGLRAAPIAFRGKDASGNDVFLPIPAGLTNGATLLTNDDGTPDVSGGGLTFSDGTVVPLGSAEAASLTGSNLIPILSAEFLPLSDFELRNGKRNRAFQNLSLTGNMTWNVFRNGRLRVGGRYNTREEDRSNSALTVVFAPEMRTVRERDEYQIFGTWTQYLSNSTFYQIQVDFSDRDQQTYDPRFGTSFDNFLEYGNIDGGAFDALRGYKNLSFTSETRTDENGAEFTVRIPTFTNTYKDGAGPATNNEVIATLMQVPGGRFLGYSKGHNQQFRLTASATTQIGLHQIEFGAEYEQRTQRFWEIDAAGLSRFVNDESGPEQISSSNTDLDSNGYSSYADIPTFVIEDFVGTYFGYDVRGLGEVDTENLEAFINQDISKSDADYNQAPYEPIYYGGYIQDKIEFRDIVLNLGLRVDVFDNNTRILKDKFARRPVCQVGDINNSSVGAISQDCTGGLPGGVPGTVGSEFSVFYSGDDIVGFRDANGTYYDTGGNETLAGDILLVAQPRQTNNQITSEMFEDYEPEVTWMPRIGVSFPITDQALFFASFGVVSQRPSSRTFTTLETLQGTGGGNNPALRPEKTTKYELGFRQRVGARAAFTITSFVHQIENLIQIREIRGASPNVYSSYENVDFGTVKGLELGLDLRRTRGISANINYTLSYADGTGSGDRSTSTIVWVDETPPNFISPLDFDQRHKFNASIDYRLGAGEGPTIFGAKLFENFGLNLLATAGSGFPYTPVVEPFNLAGGARAANPAGSINGARMPWSSRIDLRFDRRFSLNSGASFTAFLWVQNVFDQVNTNDVWRFTGLPGDDGFLSTPSGGRQVSQSPPVFETLYNHRNRVLNWVGIPRQTRLGVRLDF